MADSVSRILPPGGNELFRIAGGEFDELVADDALGADGGNGVVVQLETRLQAQGYRGPVYPG